MSNRFKDERVNSSSLQDLLLEESLEVIGVTGTPATGKKSVGIEIARKIGYEFLGINQVAMENGCLESQDHLGPIANTKSLKMLLKSRLKARRVVLVGHLLPLVTEADEVNLVVVLRCAPNELWDRLSARGYNKEKVRLNVEAEVIDLCLSEAINKYGPHKIVEVDTTGSSSSITVSSILDHIINRSQKKNASINWLKSLTQKDLLKLERRCCQSNV